MRRLSPVSILPGPHSSSGADACRGQCVHRVQPADRACELAHQERAHLSRGPHGLGIDGADVWHRGRSYLDARESLAETLTRTAHQAAVGGHADGQRDRALGAQRLRQLDGALHRGALTRDDHLARRVEIDGFDDSSGRGLPAGLLHLRVLETENGRHGAAARPAPPACMTWPRKRTRSRVGSKSRAPRAHERGELAEAVAGDHRGGPAPPRSRHRRQVATPAASMAGCVHSVAVQASSGPSSISVQRS